MASFRCLEVVGRVMSLKPLLKIGYALLVVQGALSVLAPKKAISLATSGWRMGFEHVGDLEPREWYVEFTRVTGVGMLAAGLTGLLVTAARDGADSEADERDSDDGTEDDAIDDDGTEDDATDDDATDDDDAPVEVDV
jgi:hypothetical protein